MSMTVVADGNWFLIRGLVITWVESEVFHGEGVRNKKRMEIGYDGRFSKGLW